jgi:hypothetical protein
MMTKSEKDREETYDDICIHSSKPKNRPMDKQLEESK